MSFRPSLTSYGRNRIYDNRRTGPAPCRVMFLVIFKVAVHVAVPAGTVTVSPSAAARIAACTSESDTLFASRTAPLTLATRPKNTPNASDHNKRCIAPRNQRNTLPHRVSHAVRSVASFSFTMRPRGYKPTLSLPSCRDKKMAPQRLLLVSNSLSR